MVYIEPKGVMNVIKWKSMIFTALVCLLPIVLGVVLWERLPETMAIHYDINNNADGFASKGYVVFGLPFMMTVMQVVLCIANDMSLKNRDKNINYVTKWIIPVMTIVLYVVTMLVGLGYNVDIRRVCAVIIGVVMLATGACMGKLDYVKNRDYDKETAKKINKLSGILMMVAGVLFFGSILFPPMATVICLGLLMVCGVIISVYSVKASKGM